MKKIFVAIVLSLGIVACSGDANKADKSGVPTTISGSLSGCDTDSLYLERFNADLNSVERIAATALTEDGNFELLVDVEQTGFYRLAFDDESRPVVLVVAPGDNISVEAEGNVFNSYSVTGSEESALVCEFNHTYFGYCDAIMALLNGSEEIIDEAAVREVYNLVTSAMEAQVKFIGTHSDKLAAFYAIRHTNAEEFIPALHGKGVNAVHRRTLLDKLRVSYPDSYAVAVLEQSVAEDEAISRLEGEITEIAYPEIELEDSYRISHRLSDLDGQVVVLYFWSSDNIDCLALNNELIKLYEEYHDAGLEVYQVSADIDRGLWIRTLRQQRLPWIAVYGGRNIEVFATYNVPELPTIYLIDREGNLTLCNADIDSVREGVAKLL